MIPDLNLLSDDNLLSLVRSRDGDALMALYRRYRLRIFALVLRILQDRSTAEEVLQDLFQKLWDYPEKYDSSKGELLSWLLTVARNISLDHKRKESRRASFYVYPDVETQVELASLTERRLDAETIHSVRQVLDTLPEEQKRVLELSYFEGLTHPELAETLGESLGTVKTRIRLGMQKLKHAMSLGLLQSK